MLFVLLFFELDSIETIEERKQSQAYPMILFIDRSEGRTSQSNKQGSP